MNFLLSISNWLTSVSKPTAEREKLTFIYFRWWKGTMIESNRPSRRAQMETSHNEVCMLQDTGVLLYLELTLCPNYLFDISTHFSDKFLKNKAGSVSLSFWSGSSPPRVIKNKELYEWFMKLITAATQDSSSYQLQQQEDSQQRNICLQAFYILKLYNTEYSQ